MMHCKLLSCILLCYFEHVIISELPINDSQLYFVIWLACYYPRVIKFSYLHVLCT